MPNNILEESGTSKPPTQNSFSSTSIIPAGGIDGESLISKKPSKRDKSKLVSFLGKSILTLTPRPLASEKARQTFLGISEGNIDAITSMEESALSHIATT